jgi:hypothetical protein
MMRICLVGFNLLHVESLALPLKNFGQDRLGVLDSIIFFVGSRSF